MTKLLRNNQIAEPNLLHRRQYIIGPKPVLYRSNWNCIEIEHGKVLSSCPSLPVHAIEDIEGRPWYLLGIAIETDMDRGSICDSIAATTTSSVPGLCTSWGGRWILIGDGRLQSDASGLLSCFYLQGSGFWLSSSLALLQEVSGAAVGQLDARVLRRQVGMDWYPLPRSRFSSVRALFPTQAISIDDGSIGVRNMLSIVEESGNYQRILEELDASLVTFLKRTAEQYDRIWIGLTGGLDSRVLLAAALKAGIKFKTFTFHFDKMKLADRKLPTSLARLADVEHVTVSPGRRSDPEKRELFDRHSSHCFKGRDTDYYPQNYWKFCSQGDVILKAHCFEIARCFFWKKLPFESLPDAGMIAWSFGEDSETLVRALREWTTWIERNPIENLDWRDRFYYEQRLAGWCSAHMQSNDLVGTEVLVPTNAHSILSLLLSVGLEKRRAGEHQLDLIRRMSPQLLELPVNRSTSFHPLARIYWHVRYGTLWNALGSKALRKLGKMIE